MEIRTTVSKEYERMSLRKSLRRFSLKSSGLLSPLTMGVVRLVGTTHDSRNLPVLNSGSPRSKLRSGDYSIN